MSALGAVVFDDQSAASRFCARLEVLADRDAVGLHDLAVLHRRPDERLTLEPRPSAHGAFWGLLVGLLLWPRWLGLPAATVDAAAARLDRWRLTPEWADAVSRGVSPGDVVVLFLVDDLADELFAAVRDAPGDLFPLWLGERTPITLTDTFGGDSALVDDEV
ncbi:DUF1269 domain-containing protein [Egicoccus sp. AB-alg2]|uniref:DUF1269 domain-containing protein n=1 Tax=Egicoccus sp. AB-alg2 TaxID=3242693 RepID=UPI00359D16D7